MSDLDGRIGEAWAGEVPDGSHINVVLARRGSPPAAAAAGVLASPRPGHAPFLVCPTGGGEIVRPATIVVNKSTIADDALGRITWGAAQLGSEDKVELTVSVDRTFVPAAVSAGAQKDVRELGVRVFHAFVDAR